MKKIPSKDKVSVVIKAVMDSRIKVESQQELARLVLNRLRREDKNFTLSPIRVKRIALKIPEVEVKAKTKKAIRLQRIDKCPICESSIEELKVKNLLNQFVTIGFRCTDCSYESDLEAFMPMKYEFVFRKL